MNGPVVYDERGRLVYVRPMKGKNSAFDFRVQRYQGNPVLTWWQGRVYKGIGIGDGLIVDRSYRTVARVKAGNGYHADLHEFELTSHGTALVLAYNPVRWNLSAVGRSKHGVAMDGVVQEIDVKTGLVLFEWHALGHLSLGETYPRSAAKDPFDLAHLNSVQEEKDGNLLVSVRNAHSAFELDRRSGDILWRLGGKKSSFKMGHGAQFVSQHDVRRTDDGSITVFDNGAPPAPGRLARGIRLEVGSGKARLARAYSRHVRSPSQGNVQQLQNGNVFIGWGGDTPYMTEFGKSGHLVFDAHLVPSADDSYRAYRSAWSAQPSDPPDVAADSSGGNTRVYASWNGATEVASWEVMGGPSADRLQSLGTFRRKGFETSIRVGSAQRFVAVRALDGSGHVLGTSRTVAAR
jgi:hypothetical protein